MVNFEVNDIKKEKYWHIGKRFRNLEGAPQASNKYWVGGFHWILTRVFGSTYKLGIDLPMSHVLSRKEAIDLKQHHVDVPSVTWLGHASFIFKIGIVQILTDPWLFGNAGPTIFRKLKRIPSPLKSEDLSGIDALLISHEHLDHLHKESLERLPNKEKIHVVISPGLSKKIKKYGFNAPIELDWLESQLFRGNMRITAVPAIHYSNFTNSTLWAGFVIAVKDISGKELKIYFSGDTGYGSFIKEVIAPYGPFDLACIGVGGWHLGFLSAGPLVHTNAEDAIQVAQEIGAKKVIGMHWGTAKMSDEKQTELHPRMLNHAEKIKYTGEVIMMRIGETIKI